MLAPYTVTAMAEVDVATDTNVIAGALIQLTDLNLTPVTMYDDETGSNPSTGKTTGSLGQKEIWVPPNTYLLTVAGNTVTIVVSAAIDKVLTPVASYAEALALDPDLIPVGTTIDVTDDDSAGKFIVKSGSEGSGNGYDIVSDSAWNSANKYWSRLHDVSVIKFNSIADFVLSECTSNEVEIISYYDGWASTVDGPRGGHKRFKTGGTNTAPTVGSAVSVSTIGTGSQAGYCWDASGVEWDISVQGGEIDIFALGAIGDDISDDSSSIIDSINVVSRSGGGDVLFPAPKVAWRVEAEIPVPVKVNLVGVGRSVYITVRAGAYPSNAVFLLNTTDGSDWIVSNPNNTSSIVRNLRVETDQTGLDCFCFSGSPVFEDLSFKYWGRSIVGSAQYNDLVTINRVTCAHISSPTTYQVDIANTGDGVLINQLHCFNINNNPATPLKSIKVSNNAVQITNFIGGDIELINCTAMSALRNVGMDGGKIILNKCHITMEDIALSALESEEAIQFENDSSFTRNTVLSNVTISHDIYRGAWEPHIYDIKIANGISVDMRNVFRRIIASDNPSSRNLMGVKISLESGASFPTFNRYAHFYSVRCRIEDELLVGGEIMHPLPQATLIIFTALGPYASAAWAASSGAYYYKIVPYIDVDRQVSRNTSAERSVSLTNGGSAAVLDVGDSNYSGGMVLRVYRGTATNTYSSYADVSVVDSPSLVDIGTSISGVPWTSRAAGPITTVSNSFNMLGFKYFSGNVTLKATAAATAGAWVAGDRIMNTAPVVDGNNMVLACWLRITTGSANALGVDWVAQYYSVASPAV